MTTEQKTLSLSQRFLRLGEPEIFRKNLLKLNNTLTQGPDIANAAPLIAGLMIMVIGSVIAFTRTRLYTGQNGVIRVGGKVLDQTVEPGVLPAFGVRGIASIIPVDITKRTMAFGEAATITGGDVISLGGPLHCQLLGRSGGVTVDVTMVAAIQDAPAVARYTGGDQERIMFEEQEELVHLMASKLAPATQTALSRVSLETLLDNFGSVNVEASEGITRSVQTAVNEEIVRKVKGNASLYRRLQDHVKYNDLAPQIAESLINEAKKSPKSPKATRLIAAAKKLQQEVTPGHKLPTAVGIHAVYLKIHPDEVLSQEINQAKALEFSTVAYKSMATELGTAAMVAIHGHETLQQMNEKNNPNLKVVMIEGGMEDKEPVSKRIAMTETVDGDGEDAALTPAESHAKAKKEHEKIKRASKT